MLSKDVPIGFRFDITIYYDRKRFTYPVMKTWHTPQIEHFMLVGSHKVLLIQSNRPLLRAKGLKHRHIDYKLLFGEAPYQSLLEEIINAIDLHIKKHESAIQ